MLLRQSWRAIELCDRFNVLKDFHASGSIIQVTKYLLPILSQVIPVWLCFLRSSGNTYFRSTVFDPALINSLYGCYNYEDGYTIINPTM